MPTHGLPYALSFVYSSDDDTPIATADPTYVPGIMKGKFYIAHPTKTLHYVPYWLANNANPAGIVKKKIPVHDTQIRYKCLPCDGIPFYWTLGTVTGDSPAADQFTIVGSVAGTTPDMICHKENNLMYSEQCKEYEVVNHVGGRLFLDDGQLAMELTALAQREYNMGVGTGDVLQQTSAPTKRGTVAPNIPYTVYGNANVTLAWNSLALGNFIVDLSSSWESDLRPCDIEDGNDYAVDIDNHGHRTYSEVVVKLIQVNADNDLQNLEADVDGATSSDLVLTVPRRHANDYLKITWKNAYLKQAMVLAAPEGVDELPLIECTFCGITCIEVVDRQVDAAGSAAPNADADYEL